MLGLFEKMPPVELWGTLLETKMYTAKVDRDIERRYGNISSTRIEKEGEDEKMKSNFMEKIKNRMKDIESLDSDLSKQTYVDSIRNGESTDSAIKLAKEVEQDIANKAMESIHKIIKEFSNINDIIGGNKDIEEIVDNLNDIINTEESSITNLDVAESKEKTLKEVTEADVEDAIKKKQQQTNQQKK